jgi:hypothetical protein
MGLPASQKARVFYRSAFYRFDEARILWKAIDFQMTSGPVYLAGYGIECILKALILNSLSAVEQKEMLREFRGN